MTCAVMLTTGSAALRPGAAATNAAIFPRKATSRGSPSGSGRETQSMVFFNSEERKPLYSGVAMNGLVLGETGSFQVTIVPGME